MRPWTSRAGTRAAPRPTPLAAEVDEGLQHAGFILVTGHGIDPALAPAVRAAAREFFALPDDVKQRYSVPVGGHGWLGPGVEANAYAEGTETPPDLKESYSLGAETATGDPEVDRIWFAPNVWPAEVPSLQPLVNEYTAAMRRLADDLLALFAYALGLPDEPVRRAGRPADLDDEHQPLPAGERGRRARAGPVPHRPAHRLRHGDDPRPRAGRRRAAGVFGCRRVGATRPTTPTR